jgi:hypothetical protein
MKTRIITSVVLTGAVILASCSQDRSPAISLPTEASLVKAPTCSFSTASNDAKAYFASSKDPVFGLLDLMATAYKNGNTAGTTSAGFDVLVRLGAAADIGSPTDVKGTPTQGSTFAGDVLLCMGLPTPVGLAQAFAPNGVFTVRDGSSTLAVTSRGSDAYGPLFGAEPTLGPPPATAPATWPLAGRTLFYGWPVSALKLEGEGVSGKVFELSTLPSGITFAPAIRAGVCFLDNENARILHKHANDAAVILKPAGMPGFCPPPPPATLMNSASPFTFAMRTIGSWLAPRPAYAAPATMFAFGGGGGGLVSGLSEIGPVEFTGVLDFVTPPSNSSVSLHPQFADTVKVSAKTSAGKNALEGIPITLSVVGNNSVIVFPEGNTATTNAQGIAVFPNLYINKAGGYRMTAATGDFTAIATVRFNINGQ